jgi:hypothetical protein
MSQRKSGYERKARDVYETPAWVTEALVATVKLRGPIWEPAAGGGKIVNVIRKAGFEVLASDIAGSTPNAPAMGDFLSAYASPMKSLGAVVTNPPYGLAQEFVETALAITKPFKGQVAMLLRIDWDSASTRGHLFGRSLAWSCKVVLTKRIVWFEDTGGSPSYNHAWYVWDHAREATAEPVIRYAP